MDSNSRYIKYGMVAALMVAFTIGIVVFAIDKLRYDELRAILEFLTYMVCIGGLFQLNSIWENNSKFYQDDDND